MKRASKEDLLKFKQALSTTEHLKAEKEVVATTLDKPVLSDVNVDNSVVTKAMLKEKLSVEEQINYLKYKGITFNHYSDQLGKEVLANRTYYYKVTAFRKNFSKNEDNKYSNVDFSLLNDLAVIDMHLRYLFIKLSLDIEHNIKSLIIRLITESDEDGYKIIEEYKAFELESYKEKLKKKNLREQEIEEKLVSYKTIDKKLMEEYKSPRDYSYDLWNKRKTIHLGTY